MREAVRGVCVCACGPVEECGGVCVRLSVEKSVRGGDWRYVASGVRSEF